MAHFASYVEALKREYESAYLVRNERQLMLYSFDSGERFEPGSPTSPGPAEQRRHGTRPDSC